MSPAGYWPQLQAAIEAGADAVYFGLKHFSARAKVGFPLSELGDALRTLHRRGVRGYVTFNTLVFEHELDEAARTIAAIAEAGADAMIVQDPGIVRLARQIVPGMELHASTQMSVTDAGGVRLALSQGIRRVTLARELSLAEVRSIYEETGCDLEIFVHGALCVAYSGQCFSSEAWGGRSANRGQCAQACRLPYQMMVDGRTQPLGDARYLLSPGDLYALHQMPEVIETGVAALKIEGRYKDADYVALATAAYRKTVDDAWAGRKLTITPKEELNLAQVYSRGLGPYFLNGTNHQEVVRGRAPRHRGVCMGRVLRVERDHLLIELDAAHSISPLKPGDGLVLDAADWRSPQEPEEGGRVFEVKVRLDGTAEVRFGRDAVNFRRVRPGDLVWRSHDPEIERIVRPYNGRTPLRRQPVRLRAKAIEGEPLVTVWSLVARPEITVTVESSWKLEKAQTRALSDEALKEQLGRLGGTAYEVAEAEIESRGSFFAPLSLLNQVRREAVDRLQELQSKPGPLQVGLPVPGRRRHDCRRGSEESLRHTASLHLLVRTPEQLEAAIGIRTASITLDYLDLYGLRPSLERVRESGVPVRVATPRILKPGEARIVNFLVSLDCPILVRPAGMLELLRQAGARELIGDFSLNLANSLTADFYFGLRLSRITPTHDLNGEQVAELARAAGAESFEAIAFQHLPVFHTEHCVFCRFLSTGTSFRDCGRPCEKHRVALRDENGRAHPVLADVGCRNTVFGAEAQEASAHLESWLRAGIRHFRLEFAHESAAEVRRVYDAFERALAGRMTFSELGAELKRIAPEGTTQGSLFVAKDYQLLPILQ